MGSKASMSAPALRNASTFLWKLFRMRSVARTTAGPCGKARRKSRASWKRISEAGSGKRAASRRFSSFMTLRGFVAVRIDNGRLRVG